MTEPWWISLIKAVVVVNVLLVMFAYLTLVERNPFPDRPSANWGSFTCLG